ncbi:serine hydrolase [Streptomyces sp. NPDC052051]|uniref:D-alanyl-D-alanine carboxypeptidase family protein n=1 Tax=Streptomyces sp. NPDC052051 TaxID=3154649 RepID=UPI00341EE394
MTVVFPHRIAVACRTLCAVGVLALAAPHPAAAQTRTDAAGASSTDSSQRLLYRSGTQVHWHPGLPEVPEMTALSWLVADADTGEVLAGYDAHRPLPPASTLKTLFALTVLPALPGGTRHTVTGQDLAGIGPGSSLVGVKPGLTYQVSDLWKGVFLHSGNDAVHVLASLNGGWRTTARQMQAKARTLGALDTRVVSPDGYDAPGQVSSAYDLAVFGRAGLRNADFARYCATTESSFPGDGAPYEIANTNRLLTGRDGVTAYSGLIGVKNGYTSGAGNTLVAAARRGGRTLVVTVMHPQYGGFAVYEEARRLLDWGFATSGRIAPVGSLLPPRQPVPRSTPVAVHAAKPDDDWLGAGALAGAVGAGAGAAVVALRRWGGRSTRG